MAKITVTVDGVTYTDDVEPRLLLVHYLRDTLQLRCMHNSYEWRFRQKLRGPGGSGRRG